MKMEGFEEYLREAKEILEGSSGIDFWAPKEGENRIRILPRDGTVKFWYTTGWHYRLGLEGGQNFLCPLVTLNQPCPICEKSKALFFSESEEDREVARELYVKTRYFMNIIDRETGEVQLFGAGRTLFSLILRHYSPFTGMEQAEFVTKLKLSSTACNFVDVDKGHDIVIEKIVTGKMAYEVTYSVRVVPEASPIDLSVLEKRVHPLSILPVFSYDDLLKALEGNYISVENAKKILNADMMRKVVRINGEEETIGRKVVFTGITKATKFTESEEKIEKELEEELPEQEEQVIQKPEKQEIEQKTSVRVPKCFGKEFEPDDLQCKQCEWKEKCEKESSPQQEIPVAESGEGENLTPEERIRRALRSRGKK